LEELNLLSQQPDFYSDRRKSSSVLKDLQRLKTLQETHDAFLRAQQELEDTEKLANDEHADREIRDLAASELESLRRQVESLNARVLEALIPPEPDDERNVIMEIRAGTGGDEASLFAAELYRLYTRFIEGRGWKISPMGSSNSEVGGLKEVIFSVSGTDVYKVLKHESGVHRVQRVPVTEASGRIHTSTVTVAVLPEADEVDIEIDPQELEITVQRASGAGGQGVNTTDSAVRILHKPTGMMVYCADERSQLKNKTKAMSVLRARLLRIRQEEEHARQTSHRRDQIGSGDRSDKIRTYNFPQNRLTDHRIALTVHNLPDVMEGKIDEIIDALMRAEFERKLAAIAAQPVH
jgi:peptide chain release factor 1